MFVSEMMKRRDTDVLLSCVRTHHKRYAMHVRNRWLVCETLGALLLEQHVFRGYNLRHAKSTAAIVRRGRTSGRAQLLHGQHFCASIDGRVMPPGFAAIYMQGNRPQS